MSYVPGRPYLAIPGPSPMPERVLQSMHRPSPNIYAGELVDIVGTIIPDLKRLALTAHHVAIYIGNGHAAWEAANTNMFSRGDKALVLSTGRFGKGWAEHAHSLGVKVELIDFGTAAPADPARLESALRADTGHMIKAVLVTHVDTATSILNDIPALRAAIDATGHPALLAVDCIASLGCDPFRMDDWGVDVMVSASQKGLMVPPGLGIVWFSEKARVASAGSDLVTPYWNWGPRAAPAEFWMSFAGTAPTHHLFGLRTALTMLLEEEGLEAAWARHALLARTVWAALEAWSAEGDIAMNVADPAHRGHSVTAARMGAGLATRLRDWTEARGVTLGIGLGMALPEDPRWHDFLRVAHMGHVNAHMTLGTLAVMEAGLQALGATHGPGALDAAARVVAGG